MKVDPSEIVESKKREQLMNNIRNCPLEEQAVEKILATAKSNGKRNELH